MESIINCLKKEISEKYIHAKGPGGQNVNKVSTCVQLVIPLTQTTCLPEKIKQRLQKILGKRLSSSGVWVISAQRFRTRERNRTDAWERLKAWIEKACIEPKPRKKTKPSRSSVEKRLESKAKQSERKKNRRDPLY